MKNNILFTMKALDYDLLTEVAQNPNISPEQRDALLHMIADHKKVTGFRVTLVREQELAAEGLFAYGKVEETAVVEISFDEDEPSVSQDEEKKSEENSSPDVPTTPPETPPAKRGKKALPLGVVSHYRLLESEKECGLCGQKMHMGREKSRTLVFCRPFLETQTHVVETCRCQNCQTSRDAQTPPTLQETVGRFHASAAASLVALRYLYGMASCRMETLSGEMGLRVSDSTQWTLFENTASRVLRFAAFLEKKVADAPTTHVDDTHLIIVDLLKSIAASQEEALLQGKDPKSVRSGVHTTNLTGVYNEGTIVLFRSGLHHAGEALAKVLGARTTQEVVVIMADAASANTSKLHSVAAKTEIANCNSHSVRKAKDLAAAEAKVARDALVKDHKTSEPVDFFLKKCKTVFENDAKTKGMTPKDRLEYHRSHSLPVMESLLKRIEGDFRNKRVEPASDLGKVYNYFKNHFTELSAFCRVEGAPVTNNLSERMLKGAIRHRKNSLFVRNTLGARVADVFWTILFTAKANGVAPMEYLTNLLRFPDSWRSNPEAWLPWNYPTTIAALSK